PRDTSKQPQPFAQASRARRIRSVICNRLVRIPGWLGYPAGSYGSVSIGWEDPSDGLVRIVVFITALDDNTPAVLRQADCIVPDGSRSHAETEEELAMFRIRHFVLCVFLFVPVAFAQQEFGSIQGSITDSDGTTIPGVMLTVSGTSLIGGSSISTTN